MEIKLIKTEVNYLLKNEEGVIIASTSIKKGISSLSKQNCDEIFGVVDVEKLADTICIRTTESFAIREVWKDGFNKAMELNKDKQFTLEDVLNAYMEGTNDGTQFESLMDYDSENFDEAHEFAKEAEKEFRESLQQPTEIEVQIVMKEILQLKKRAGGFTNMGKPKLDADGCLILKKI